MIDWFKTHVWNRAVQAAGWLKNKVVSWAGSPSSETIQLVLAGCALAGMALAALALLCKCLPLLIAMLALLGLVVLLRTAQRLAMPL